MGGYQFSYSIVDFIVKKYGYDKLVTLIKMPTDFEKDKNVYELVLSSNDFNFTEKDLEAKVRKIK